MSTASKGVTSVDLGPTEAVIGKQAEACRDLLLNAFDSLRGLNDGGIRWARLRDLTGRFNMWASNMGAFAALHSSLDYRLRDSTDVKELIIEHLDSMVDRVESREHDTRTTW